MLVTRTVGWEPPTTNPRPLAEDYYRALRNSVRFQPITNANDLEVGDLLALLDGFHFAPAGNAGHHDDRFLGPIDRGAQCSSDAECLAQ